MTTRASACRVHRGSIHPYRRWAQAEAKGKAGDGGWPSGSPHPRKALRLLRRPTRSCPMQQIRRASFRQPAGEVHAFRSHDVQAGGDDMGMYERCRPSSSIIRTSSTISKLLRRNAEAWRGQAAAASSSSSGGAPPPPPRPSSQQTAEPASRAAPSSSSSAEACSILGVVIGRRTTASPRSVNAPIRSFHRRPHPRSASQRGADPQRADLAD